jgi:hypothetical protein
MMPREEAIHWVALQRRAHRPEVQEQIRAAIRAGLIRVVPSRERGIRIIPAGNKAEVSPLTASA